MTRELDLTIVLASYCRDMDVQIAAVLLAKGVLQDLPSSADRDELAATRDSIGAPAPCTTQPLIRCTYWTLQATPEQMPGYSGEKHVSGSYCVDFQGD